MKFIFVQAGSCVNTENQHGTFFIKYFREKLKYRTRNEVFQ